MRNQHSAQQPKVVGFGEIVWDILPDETLLGGAPANFTYQANCLGSSGLIVSAVGRDSLGNRALERFRALGLSTELVQVNDFPTGTVDVTLDQQGLPEFTICRNAAWDYLEWTGPLERLAGEADAVCFGSLAQRAPQTRTTLHRLLKSTREEALRVFDINLRAPFYDRNILVSSLELANVVKLNDEELVVLSGLLGINCTTPLAAASEIFQTFSLELICVTRGSAGSLLVSKDGFSDHAGVEVEVADTIGSGDAFLAAMIHFHLNGAPLDVISEAANQLGAWVATQSGATSPESARKAQEIVRLVEEGRILEA
jgi:fructokinase